MSRVTIATVPEKYRDKIPRFCNRGSNFLSVAVLAYVVFLALVPTFILYYLPSPTNHCQKKFFIGDRFRQFQPSSDLKNRYKQ